MKAFKKHLVTLALCMASCTTTAVMAESDSTTTAPFSVQANLDFQIIIPSSLSFQVGTDGGTIDLIQFDTTLTVLGNGTDVAGTGGDQTGGVVTVELLSNAGQVTITPTNNSGGAGLDNGAGDHIPYTEILTESSNVAVLPEPVLSNAGGTAVLVPLTSGQVTDLAETWTYTYDNTAVYAAGTYGGKNTQGGRVTYTAAVL